MSKAGHTQRGVSSANHHVSRPVRLGVAADVAVPDFHIDIQGTLANGPVVALSGFADGTFPDDGTLRPENRSRVPAASCIAVDNGLTRVWQLFINPEPIVSIHQLLNPH